MWLFDENLYFISKRSPYSEISDLWKAYMYLIFIFHPILMGFFVWIGWVESFR